MIFVLLYFQLSSYNIANFPAPSNHFDGGQNLNFQTFNDFLYISFSSFLLVEMWLVEEIV